jgi:hypothetical protein
MKKFNGFHIVFPGLFKILAKGVTAITLWPFVFYKSDALAYRERTVVHETIHIRQQTEVGIIAIILYVILVALTGVWFGSMLILPLFYYLYVMHWLILIPRVGSKEAYYQRCFEHDAYTHQYDISKRSPFGWIKYFAL